MVIGFRIALLCGLLLITRAACSQGGPVSGFYQIQSGRYIECCGIGGPIPHLLPNSSQSFVELAVDAQSQTVQMSFLGQDRTTVFRTYATGFVFSFSHGTVVSSNEIRFTSLFTPERDQFEYRVTYSANALGINGTVLLPPIGADIPNQFNHTNVVAALLPAGPIVEGLERESGVLRFRFIGEPAYDYFVEYSESLPAAQWLSLTNFRAKLQTIEAVVTDSLTNSPARFYRIRKEDCQCD